MALYLGGQGNGQDYSALRNFATEHLKLLPVVQPEDSASFSCGSDSHFRQVFQKDRKVIEVLSDEFRHDDRGLSPIGQSPSSS